MGTTASPPEGPQVPAAGDLIDALPLFPLGTTLYPGGTLQLRIFEARYLDLMSRCLREGSPFGVVTLKSGSEVGREAVELHAVGTLATLLDVDAPQAGILMIRAVGGRRVALADPVVAADGLWTARATLLRDDPVLPPAARHGALVTSLVDAVDQLAAQGAHPFAEPHRFDEAGWVADRWCEILPLPPEVKQHLLCVMDPLARLDIVEQLMAMRRGPPPGG